MTDNDIIKALECCINAEDCDACPYFVETDGERDCKGIDWKDVLDLINRQQAEIDNLKIELQAMRNAANGYKAEVERLQKEVKLLTENTIEAKYPNCVLVGNGVIFTKTLEEYDKLIGDISAEAVKEFADLAIKTICENVVAPSPTQSYIVEKCNEIIDNLVKEMEG